VTTKTQVLLKVLLVFALPLLLSGCFLRSMFGNVIIVSDIGEEVNEIITTIFSGSTAAVCLEPGNFGFFECTYIIDGEEVTSSFYLISELGLAGVLIDPLVLQVPQNVESVTATFDDGSGAGQRPLIQQYTTSFQVTPALSVTAEAEQKFIILELPPTVTDNLVPGDPTAGPVFTYTLQFSQFQPIADPIQPVEVKALLTGKVTINEHNYFVPILPCATSFADIPALQIPQSTTPLSLQTAVGDLIRQGSNITCDHVGYFFDNVPPPPLKTYLPLVTR